MSSFRLESNRRVRRSSTWNPPDSGRWSPGRDGKGRAGQVREEREAQRLKEREPVEADLRSRAEQTDSAEFAWHLALQLLADHLRADAMGLWVAPLRCLGEVDGSLLLEAESIRSERYAVAISEAIRGVSHFEGAELCLA